MDTSHENHEQASHSRLLHVVIVGGGFGGLDRWRQFETVSAHLLTGGIMWPLKHQQGVLDDVRVRASLRKEWASHRPFGAPDLRTTF